MSPLCTLHRTFLGWLIIRVGLWTYFAHIKFSYHCRTQIISCNRWESRENDINNIDGFYLIILLHIEHITRIFSFVTVFLIGCAYVGKIFFEDDTYSWSHTPLLYDFLGSPIDPPDWNDTTQDITFHPLTELPPFWWDNSVYPLTGLPPFLVGEFGLPPLQGWRISSNPLLGG